MGDRTNARQEPVFVGVTQAGYYSPPICSPILPYPQCTLENHHVTLWLWFNTLPTPAWAWTNGNGLFIFLTYRFFYWGLVYIQENKHFFSWKCFDNCFLSSDYHTKHDVEHFHHLRKSLLLLSSPFPRFSQTSVNLDEFSVLRLLKCKRNRCSMFSCGCLLLLNMCFELHPCCCLTFLGDILLYEDTIIYLLSSWWTFGMWTLFSGEPYCTSVYMKMFSFLLDQILWSGIAGNCWVIR